MFINKINGITNIGFKSLGHVKNSVGETVEKFNYVYDPEKETCEVQIFKVSSNDKYNINVDETPIAIIPIEPNGTEVNLQNITNLDKDEAFAYRIVKREKGNPDNIIWQGADTGVKIKKLENGEYGFRVSDGREYNDHLTKEEPFYFDNNNNKKEFNYEMNEFADSPSNYAYTLVTRNGTAPLVQGPGYLAQADTFKPGMRVRGFDDENTGTIYYDKDYQKKAENTVRTFSNNLGGTYAGLEAMADYLKANGYKIAFTLPIANGDNVSGHGYWNKNNMQVSDNMGNAENFTSLFKKLYKNGLGYVFDATLTSEGLEGVHFQYALRWADKNPQSYYWFRMSGLKNGPLGLGVIPENKENLRHRVVNAPYNYELQSDGTYKKVANPNYKDNQPTLFQIYDGTQVTDEQIKKLDEPIKIYENLKAGNNLGINNHDDTLINYVFEINPREYDKRISVINELNKKDGKNIKLDTADGTILAAQFSNFRIDKKTEGGFVTWDANTDMVKMNYGISGYDEKLLKAITNRSLREHEQEMFVRGSKEVQDMALQTGRYWTQRVKDIQLGYTAKTLGYAKTSEAIEKLIKEGKLPEEAGVNSNIVNNILNRQYNLEPKGILSKDDVTVKSLMKLPLDSLEFGENTVGVLSTSFFSNRATTDETLGMTRFELMKKNNPHLVEPYSNVYNKVNDNIFNSGLKNFAQNVIKKVNESVGEKLTDSNGNYTEYGEYVMELVGQDIAKYALLKALAGESFRTKILPDGELTYDYEGIKKNTSLQSLNVHGRNPEDEAMLLQKRIVNGLKTLDTNDINMVADSISRRIQGTDVDSFRLAEAIVEKSGLGLNFRLDAAKDVMDIDAVRNRDDNFDDTWNNLIKFWSRYVQEVKKVNPHSSLTAEMTDVSDVMRDTTGPDLWPYNGDTNIGQRFNGEPDAMAKFFNQTGITTEAAYSYLFTNMLTNFAYEFETGTGKSDTHDAFKGRYDLLLETRSADYLRNLYSFQGNHDKPRIIHGLAVDMGLYQSPLVYDGADFGARRNHRLDVIRVMSGAKDINDIPLELRLNVDNLNYFRTISSKAVAQTKLLSSSVDEDLVGIATKEDIKLIKSALIDLANGNFMDNKVTEKMTRINIKELSTLENAIEEVMSLAEKQGIILKPSDKFLIKHHILDNAKKLDWNNYNVHGDFDWTFENIGELNKKTLREILGTDSDAMKYSVYTVQVAKLIQDAIQDSTYKDAVNTGLKQLVQKYDRNYIEQNSTPYKMYENPALSMKKNGYGARDFKEAMRLAIEQAEFKSGRKINNKERIISKVYQSVTEPAVQKASMLMSFLNGLSGIHTMYGGDELGMSGFDEKAKNIYLQNRNALPWSEVEDKNSLIGEVRRKYMDRMNGAMRERTRDGLAPLRDITPYGMDVMAHSLDRNGINERIAKINKELAKPNIDEKTKQKLSAEKALLYKDLAKVAYLMQGSDGEIGISVFNASGIEHDNRFDYFKKFGIEDKAKREKFYRENNIDSINFDNRYVPIQEKTELDAILLAAGMALPIGTCFINADARDKVQYVVGKVGDRLGIVRKDGKKIVMDGITAKNGVMMLRKVKNFIPFRGKSQISNRTINEQYNFVSNPYVQKDKVINGEKLSVISK